ncbi:hypothetical protein HMPREF1139_2319 [Campylobacter sp. FOBRC14]|jgi:hypothetical protein|nr:hypothetical protein HMPREF1139_2319 [Campylobacter sp. FOBRC14]
MIEILQTSVTLFVGGFILAGIFMMAVNACKFILKGWK